MEGFQSNQASRFHTILNVINEPNKWTNATDKDQDQALNTCMAEISSCTSGPPKNELTSSTQPSTSSFPLVVDQKWPWPGENESPDHLFQTGDEEEEESVHGRKQAQEEDMSWFSPTFNLWSPLMTHWCHPFLNPLNEHWGSLPYELCNMSIQTTHPGGLVDGATGLWTDHRFRPRYWQNNFRKLRFPSKLIYHFHHHS